MSPGAQHRKEGSRGPGTEGGRERRAAGAREGGRQREQGSRGPRTPGQTGRRAAHILVPEGLEQQQQDGLEVLLPDAQAVLARDLEQFQQRALPLLHALVVVGQLLQEVCHQVRVVNGHLGTQGRRSALLTGPRPAPQPPGGPHGPPTPCPWHWPHSTPSAGTLTSSVVKTDVKRGSAPTRPTSDKQEPQSPSRAALPAPLPAPASARPLRGTLAALGPHAHGSPTTTPEPSMFVPRSSAHSVQAAHGPPITDRRPADIMRCHARGGLTTVCAAERRILSLYASL